MDLLKEYKDGTVDGDEVVDYWLKKEAVKCDVPSGTKRLNGLPEDFPVEVPDDLKKDYLYRLYENIKKNGVFPYHNIRVYKQKNGTLYCKDSHRVACLIYLGYKEIPVVIVEEESGWNE